jgi:hypothetical protein
MPLALCPTGIVAVTWPVSMLIACVACDPTT